MKVAFLDSPRCSPLTHRISMVAGDLMTLEHRCLMVKSPGSFWIFTELFDFLIPTSIFCWFVNRFTSEKKQPQTTWDSSSLLRKKKKHPQKQKIYQQLFGYSPLPLGNLTMATWTIWFIFDPCSMAMLPVTSCTPRHQRRRRVRSATRE